MTKPILLLTRPRQSSDRFHDGLSKAIAARAELIVSPLLEIVGTGAKLDLSGVWGAIFTSAHAVGFGPAGNGRAAFCVGETTQAAARARGWDIRQVSATAEDLLAEMDIVGIGGAVVHLAGRHLRMDIASVLRARGIAARAETVYDQKLLPLSTEAQLALVGTSPVIAPLFSPRSASHFVAQAADLTQVNVVAISPAVAEVLPICKCASVVTARRPTAQEMRRSVEKLLSGHRLA